MTWQVVGLVVVVALALLALVLVLLPARRRADLVLLLASTLASIYVLDALLPDAATDPMRWSWLEAAHARGQPFDERTMYQVVQDLRAEGVPANLLLPPTVIARSDEFATLGLLPLAGLARTPTVACNEAGEWAVYTTDRYGFNNDDDAFEDPRPRVVLLGDSFVFGVCVPREANLVGRLRAAGLNAIGLGYPGNGPLIELATLREYGLAPTPQTVLWVYYGGNDLEGLAREWPEASLRHYLDPAYLQGLTERGDEVEAVLRRFAEAREAEVREREQLARLLPARLYALSKLALQRVLGEADIDHTATLDNLERVLARAQADCDAAGARLAFLFLPDANVLLGREVAYRDEVLDRVSALGIPVIDAEAALLDLPEPASTMPWGLLAHFNERGYDTVANAILRSLDLPASAPVVSAQDD